SQGQHAPEGRDRVRQGREHAAGQYQPGGPEGDGSAAARGLRRDHVRRVRAGRRRCDRPGADRQPQSHRPRHPRRERERTGRYGAKARTRPAWGAWSRRWRNWTTSSPSTLTTTCLTRFSRPSRPHSLKVLGVDPGLVGTGYGLIEPAAGGVAVLGSGVISTSADLPLDARIHLIYDGIRGLLEAHTPTVLVLEDLYAEYRFPRTALLMAHAR